MEFMKSLSGASLKLVGYNRIGSNTCFVVVSRWRRCEAKAFI